MRGWTIKNILGYIYSWAWSTKPTNELVFLGMRIAIAIILLAAGLSNPARLPIALPALLITYMIANFIVITIREKTGQKPWSYLIATISDALLITSIFSILRPFESYMICTYFFLISSSSLIFGIKGSLASATFITILDYTFTQLLAVSAYLYGPPSLRIGSSWVAALAFGLIFRNISENNEKIQQLNTSLNSKVTVLTSASRILASINNPESLALYFKEIIWRIFSVDKYALVMVNNEENRIVGMSNLEITVNELSDRFPRLKKGSLDTGVELKGLGLTIAATQEGSQGSYILLTKGDKLEILLDDPDVFKTIFGQFVMAMDSSMLMQKVKQASLTDHLTGLYNQRYFYERVSGELKRTHRSANKLSLLMIDIDNFKNYNDSYGHLNGDKALSKIAHLISDCCRETDVAARYGGEEFVVILPDTDIQSATQVADRMIKSIADKTYPGKDNQSGISLTVSIGIAGYPEHGFEAIEIIDEADKALYKAKKLGKNRFVVAEESPKDSGIRNRNLRGA